MLTYVVTLSCCALFRCVTAALTLPMADCVTVAGGPAFSSQRSIRTLGGCKTLQKLLNVVLHNLARRTEGQTLAFQACCPGRLPATAAMGAVVSIAATVGTLAAIVHDVKRGNFKHLAVDILSTTAFGKVFSLLAATPIGWIAAQFGKGSTSHAVAQLLVKTVGNVNGWSRLSRGLLGLVKTIRDPAAVHIANAAKDILIGTSGRRSVLKIGGLAFRAIKWGARTTGVYKPKPKTV